MEIIWWGGTYIDRVVQLGLEGVGALGDASVDIV